MTFMPCSKCTDGKVLKATVCADSAALSDAGVNNNGSAAGRGGVGVGGPSSLIDSTKAASAINLMAIII